MDIGSIDLTALTWQQFAVVALAVSVARWVLAVVAALKPPNTFSVGEALAVFPDHVLSIVAPIAGVAFISMSLPPDSAARIATWAIASGGLALYVADTVKSAAANWQSGATQPAAPPTTSARAVTPPASPNTTTTL